jgi:hypothetical protein
MFTSEKLMVLTRNDSITAAYSRSETKQRELIQDIVGR